MERLNFLTELFGHQSITHQLIFRLCGTTTLNTWNEQLLPAYFGDIWPIGQYTVTFTADTGNAIEETNESDNVIIGTFTVSAEI